MPTPKCFGTKVPSSGSSSETEVRRFYNYIRHYSPTLQSQNLNVAEKLPVISAFCWLFLNMEYKTMYSVNNIKSTDA